MDHDTATVRTAVPPGPHLREQLDETTLHVAAALARLFDSLEQLDNLAVSVTDRLGPILRSEPVGADIVDGAPPVSCELALQIVDATRRVDAIALRLLDLHGRVGL